MSPSSSISLVRERWRARPGAPAISALNHAKTPARSDGDLQLYFAIEAARTGDRSLIVQFVGVDGGEGVSTVAAAFARKSAREPQSTILLVTCGGDEVKTDMQLRPLPSLLDQFLAGRPLVGASTAIASDNAEAAPGGPRRARLGHAAETEINLRMLNAFADELRRSFSVIVLDCPPVAGSPLSAVLSRIADGSVVVSEAGRTSRSGLEGTVAEISRMGGQVVGLVLNRQRDWLPAWLRRILG